MGSMFITEINRKPHQLHRTLRALSWPPNRCRRPQKFHSGPLGTNQGLPSHDYPIAGKGNLGSQGLNQNGKKEIPPGKHTKNYGKSPFSMGKSTISMVIFNSYVSLPEGNCHCDPPSIFQLAACCILLQ